MAPSEAAFLFAFCAPGICDSGQGICLLTMSFYSFAEGKHSVHWFLWLSWLVPLASVQWLFLCSSPQLGASQKGRGLLTWSTGSKCSLSCELSKCQLEQLILFITGRNSRKPRKWFVNRLSGSPESCVSIANPGFRNKHKSVFRKPSELVRCALWNSNYNCIAHAPITFILIIIDNCLCFFLISPYHTLFQSFFPT